MSACSDISCDTAENPHSLLFPIADGDDALAFAIPLQVVAGTKPPECQHASSWARRKREKTRARRANAHLPRDDFELAFERLIFAHDVPNANWEKRPPGSGRVLRDEEEVRGGGGGAYQCQQRRLKRNSIPWEIHVRRSCSERVRCTLSQVRDSFTHFPLTIRRSMACTEKEARTAMSRI